MILVQVQSQNLSLSQSQSEPDTEPEPGNITTLSIKISNTNTDNNIVSNSFPSLNWINDSNNYRFSSVSLSEPSTKKSIMINFDDQRQYNINWVINSGTGSFNLISNLYDGNYNNKINMNTQNSFSIDTTLPEVSAQENNSGDPLFSYSDNLVKNYLINDEDKHELYDYFSNLDRNTIENMTQMNVLLWTRILKQLIKIFYGYFEESVENLQVNDIDDFKVTTCTSRVKYSKTTRRVREFSSPLSINVDVDKQFNYNNLPKKVHKIKGKIKDISLEENSLKNKKRFKKNIVYPKNIPHKKVKKNNVRTPWTNPLPNNSYEHIQTLTSRTTTSPLDPCCACNGEFIVSVRNSTEMYIYDMNLTLLSQHSTNSLFNSSSGSGDPIIMYDTYLNLWVLIEFGIGNALSFCRSTTSNPNPVESEWESWLITTPSFPDYPKLAIYKNYYVISTNESSPRTYIFSKDDFINPPPNQSLITISMDSTTNSNNNLPINAWGLTLNNPFNMTPSGSYQPDWGVSKVTLPSDTQYTFRFVPGSYEDEVRFKVANLSSPTNALFERQTEITDGTTFEQEIYTGTSGNGIPVSTEILIFVGDTYGDGWNGGYIEIVNQDTNENIDIDIEGLNNHAIWNTSYFFYKQIDWPSLSYYGFQLVIPMSTTYNINDDEVYLIRHVDDEALGENNTEDRLEIFTVNVPQLTNISGNNNTAITKQEIAVQDFTSSINDTQHFLEFRDQTILLWTLYEN